MYKDLPGVPPLPDELVLWRYMDFTKFMSLLEKGALYFCRADLLGDPFEGALSTASADLVRWLVPPRDKEGYRSIKVSNREMRELVHVSCWHQGEGESEAMWRLYAREQDGIAIKTNFGRFRDSLVGDESVYGGAVRYEDYSTARIPFDDIFTPLFHKRQSFSHEQEFRAVVHGVRQALVATLASNPFERKKGCYCDIELSTLVMEVVVAPFAEQWFFDLVGSFASQYGLGGRVRRSTQAETPSFEGELLLPEETKETK